MGNLSAACSAPRFSAGRAGGPGEGQEPVKKNTALRNPRQTHTINRMYGAYEQTRTLDACAIEQLGLSEDILMENAAQALEQAADEYLGGVSDAHAAYDVLIAVGGGDNGADGWTLARRIHKKYRAAVYAAKDPASKACKRQAERALACGVVQTKRLDSCAVLVECIAGSGYVRREPDEQLNALIAQLNAMNAYRIACDIPAGLCRDGQTADTVFKADITVTMGAPKTALYSDAAKDYTGRIVTATLGVSQAVFTGPFKPDLMILEPHDMRLPLRTIQNTHKNSYGHCAVFAGAKEGAALIAAQAALTFGAGLVSLVETGKPLACVPCELMHGNTLPRKTTAILAGPGLGEAGCEAAAEQIRQNPHIPAVFDADMLASAHIRPLLAQRAAPAVLTPHLGEFAALLDAYRIPHSDIPAKRLSLLRELCARVPPHTVIVCKGANTCIGCRDAVYAAAGGSSALAKAGSGDVLAGMTAALLAQGYGALDAACTAVLAHAQAAADFVRGAADFALTPTALIKAVSALRQPQA